MSANDPQVQAQLPPAPPTPPPIAAPAAASRKSPGIAVIFSVLPGLGHVYLGLYQRGVAFALSALAVIWIGDHAEMGPFLGFFVWGFAFIDAYRQANLINQAAATGVMPEPLQLPKSRGSLGFGVFLTLLGVLLLYNQFYPLDLTFLVDWWPMLLVLAGVYMLAKHFVEQKKQRDAALSAESL